MLQYLKIKKKVKNNGHTDVSRGNCVCIGAR